MKAKLLCKQVKAKSSKVDILTLGYPSNDEPIFGNYYFGMPDNKVYLLEINPYKTPKRRRGYLEVVVYDLRALRYDYNKGILYNLSYKEGADIPQPLGALENPTLEKILLKRYKGFNIPPSDFGYTSIAENCYKKLQARKGRKKSKGLSNITE
jgi:hypothetical protein